MTTENLEKPTLNFRTVGGWQIDPISGNYKLREPERFELYESNGADVRAVAIIDTIVGLTIKTASGYCININGCFRAKIEII